MSSDLYHAHLPQILEIFASEGVDTTVTMGDGIFHFYMQPGIDPDAFSTVRAQFHEGMHVQANALDGTTLSEMKASVPERVFMRGRWSFTINHEDESQFDEPRQIPSLDSVTEATLFRCGVIEPFGGNRDSRYNDEAIDTIPALYEQALEDEAFFQCISRGRALYQFTAADMRAMPLCFFGVYKEEGDGFEVKRIPQEVRQRLCQKLNALFEPEATATADLSVSGAVAGSAPPTCTLK